MEKKFDEKIFICPCCNKEKDMSRASKRMRLGIRKLERCLDCDSDAQREYTKENREKIRVRARENWPKHREAQKDYSLKRMYGISKKEWDEMHAAQDHSCAICHSKTTKGHGWHTDHNHSTGKVRAILCHHCNSLIGYSKESPETLLSAFRYLYVHGGGPESFVTNYFKEKENGIRQ